MAEDEEAESEEEDEKRKPWHKIVGKMNEETDEEELHSEEEEEIRPWPRKHKEGKGRLEKRSRAVR